MECRVARTIASSYDSFQLLNWISYFFPFLLQTIKLWLSFSFRTSSVILIKQTLIKKSVISEGGTVKTSRILSTFIKYQCHHPLHIQYPWLIFPRWVLFVVIHWNKQVFFWCIYKSNLPSEHFAALSTRFFLFWSL